MEKILWDIVIGMEEERKLLKGLLELSVEKTDVLASRDIEEIERIVEAEKKLVLRVEDLESLRMEQLQKLSKIKGVEADSIIISTLIDWSEGDIKERFIILIEEMEEIIEKQRQLNEINSEIIRVNLAYFEFFMSALSGEGSQGQVYEKQGRVTEGNQSRSILDTKA